jgi:outer membrane protein OmpA-like peptidoglycan-associated protein
MSPTLRTLLLTAACAWQASAAFAGTVADAHEAQIPARLGVAVEPSHRAQVIAPGLKPIYSLRVAPVWVVTEPVRQRVLLPGEERALLDAQLAMAEAEASRDAVDQGAQGAGRSGTGRVAATVYFPFDSSRPINGAALSEYARSIAPTLQGLRITGHADVSGSESYNLGLSLRRAKSVARVFGDAGVVGSRLTVEGKGESEPTGSTDPSLDRRVEIRLLPEAGK